MHLRGLNIFAIGNENIPWNCFIDIYVNQAQIHFGAKKSVILWPFDERLRHCRILQEGYIAGPSGRPVDGQTAVCRLIRRMIR